ncbi:hypothetical protein ABH992_000240 [Bradyrhizobium yuanmingense]|uniref:Uncharacterized protein n=1 Tax=Bradyrhizobium yuanmingense TaxID=108015 RepID=A0ABV4G8K3_9BRAD
MIAELATKHRVLLMHCFTDYVFKGFRCNVVARGQSDGIRFQSMARLSSPATLPFPQPAVHI